MLGMTCTQLGHALGTTFQQIQKYERGINRVSASKLLDLSRVLNVPISFFFESFNADVAEAISQAAAAKSEPVARKDEPDPMMRREILVLVRAYCRISDRRTRQSIADLVIRMAREEKGFMN
jgi:transcriptional regulator with XRE-family HTH domain